MRGGDGDSRYMERDNLSRGKPKQGHCDYCGEYANLTRDHVIPKALWGTAGLPSHPRPAIVHACATCNNVVKSANDMFVEELLSVDYKVWESGKAGEIFDATRKAVRNNQTEIAQSVRDAEPTWIMVNGLAVPAYEVRLPAGRVEESLAMIVRGLSVYYAARRLPLDTEYVVRTWYDARGLDDILLMCNVHNVPYYAIGDGSVFDCRYWAVSEGTEEIDLWILRFYSCAFYTVSTHAPGTAPATSFSFPVSGIPDDLND